MRGQELTVGRLATRGVRNPRRSEQGHGAPDVRRGEWRVHGMGMGMGWGLGLGIGEIQRWG